MNIGLGIGKIFLVRLQKCLVSDETFRIDYSYWMKGDNDSSNIPNALCSSRSNNLMTCWFWQNIIFNCFLLRKIWAYPSEYFLTLSLSLSLSLSPSLSLSSLQVCLSITLKVTGFLCFGYMHSVKHARKSSSRINTPRHLYI